MAEEGVIKGVREEGERDPGVGMRRENFQYTSVRFIKRLLINLKRLIN